MTPINDLVDQLDLPDPQGTKDDRGTLAVIGGPASCPGGVQLAARAALRVGVGRVQAVVHPDAAMALATAMPELFVTGWDLRGDPPAPVRDLLASADAVVIGPGFAHDPGPSVDAVASAIPDAALVLDAGALGATWRLADGAARLTLAPNASEAAAMVGDAADDPDPAVLALGLAKMLGRPVTVRGERTVVANDEGACWFDDGPACLGTAGSGDVFVGALGGLVAQGLSTLAAMAWAVVAHADAGRRLSAHRRSGWLAREIADAIPDALEARRHAEARRSL